jgi:RHS repeat-associated protein
MGTKSNLTGTDIIKDSVSNATGSYSRTIGDKRYEMTDHLGNVLAVITDKKIAAGIASDTATYYKAEVINEQDYYPFGMPIKERSYTISGGSGYKYGYNGKLKDNDITVENGDYDYGARIYDSRLGRWMSVDPLFVENSSYTPYIYCGNNPIIYKDSDGKDWILVTGNRVYWYDGISGDRTTLLHVYKSTSEYKGLDINNNKADYQKAKYQIYRNAGPTPEGLYHINLKPNPNRIAKAGGDGELKRQPDGEIEKNT